MSYLIDIQHASLEPVPVSDETLQMWATKALSTHKDAGELTLRFVTPQDMQQLNKAYRKQDKETNVLAFPSSIPDDIALDLPFLGDVIICPAVLKQESDTLNKSLKSHWAHIVVHGVLHILGYDHIEDDDARVMQPLETDILAQLGFEDPYHQEDNTRE